MVRDSFGNKRRLFSCDEESFSGYPFDHAPVLKKAGEDNYSEDYANRRHALLGNSCFLFVTAFIATSFVLPDLARADPSKKSSLYEIDKQAFEWGSDSRPYIKDRLQLGRSIDVDLLLDWEEMNAAHGVAVPAEKSRDAGTTLTIRGGLVP
jgi:hypothetical protein